MKTLVSSHGCHAMETCCHAAGLRRDILKRYRKNGFTYVAVTEHLPSQFVYPDEQEQGYNAEQLRQRFARYWRETVPVLRQDFQDIGIQFGFETEYVGDSRDQLIIDSIADFSPDFVVASVHHVNVDGVDFPIDFDKASYNQAMEKCGGAEQLQLQYYDRQFDLIQCLSKFRGDVCLVLGHIDLIRIFNPAFTLTPNILAAIDRNIRAAIAANFVFEVNARGMRKGHPQPYPIAAVLKRIGQLGGEITFGDDSHAVDDVGNFYEQAYTYAKNQGFKEACYRKRGPFGTEIVYFPL